LLIVRVRHSAAYWAWLFGRLRRFWRGVSSGVNPQLEAIALEGGEQTQTSTRFPDPQK